MWGKQLRLLNSESSCSCPTWFVETRTQEGHKSGLRCRLMALMAGRKAGYFEGTIHV